MQSCKIQKIQKLQLIKLVKLIISKKLQNIIPPL